jgi:nitrogenase molybdenum-iron protein alpha/beta subunit
LHELRAAWRLEISHKLGCIDPKEAAATKNLLAKSVRAMRAQANGKKAAIEAGGTLAELHLLNVSLGLHLALAQASGTEEAFMKISLPEEVVSARKLRNQVKLLAERVGEKHEMPYNQLIEIGQAFGRTVDTFEPLAVAMDSGKPLECAPTRAGSSRRTNPR